MNAQVAELVYALVLGTSSSRIEGSSPSLRTKYKRPDINVWSCVFCAQEQANNFACEMDSKDFSLLKLCEIKKYLLM